MLLARLIDHYSGVNCFGKEVKLKRGIVRVGWRFGAESLRLLRCVSVILEKSTTHVRAPACDSVTAVCRGYKLTRYTYNTARRAALYIHTHIRIREAAFNPTQFVNKMMMHGY
ncbi:hypothetical protein J6590_010980 [Homalodisca vitripennis]|nr:hypothetical protein J6590_010980 [Homalodisca vitripennis]